MQPSLETERLLLRPLKLNDGPMIQKLAGDKRVAATTLNVPHPYPDGAAEEWIETHSRQWTERQSVTFAIVQKATDTLIGCISLAGISPRHHKGEAGYWIGFDYWNKGFATEALKALINFAFVELKLHKVTARHMAKNPASGRVMLKAGMQQEGHLRDDCFRYGNFEDSIVYGILNSKRNDQ